MQDHDGPLKTNPDARRGESARRRRVITHSLQGTLSPDELQHALRICDEYFPVDKAFTASEYLQRLKMGLPHLQLDDEIRLRFLHACRLPDGESVKAPVVSPPEDAQPQAADPPPQGNAKLFADAIQAIQSGAQTRQARRLSTDLKGQYQRQTPDLQTAELVIEDLSRGGVKLRTLKTHQIQPHEMLRLQFSLDDESSSRVSTYIRVLWIEGDTLGGEFQNPQALPEALVTFLQSQ